MAWLALSTLRLENLAEESRRPSRRRSARIRRSLTLQFDSASTDDLGGGTFWSTKRDFKNTPATAPVALYYARTGNPARAQALLDWLDAKLFDPGRGLYLDGLRISPTGETILENAIYTYNQGPVLGALLELGGTQEPGARRCGGGCGVAAPDAGRRPPQRALTEQHRSRHCRSRQRRRRWDRRRPPLRRNGRRRAVHRDPHSLPCPGRTGRTPARGHARRCRPDGHGHRRSLMGGPQGSGPR